MNLRMYLIPLTVAVMLISPSSRGEEGKQGPVEQLVRKKFQELSSRQQRDVVVLEVCFDLCDVFQWRGSLHSQEAWDFVLAYEYKTGVGKESKEFISNGKTAVQAAAKRMSAYCKEDRADVEAPFVCPWAALAKNKSIRVGTSAYDEGQRCFGWRDLSSEARPIRPNCTPVKEVPWKRETTNATK